MNGAHLTGQASKMIDNSYNAIYKRNLLLSFYWVLSGLSVLYFLLLFLFIFLRFVNLIGEETAEEQPEEVRYAINLKEETPKKIVSNINENQQKPVKSDYLSTSDSKSTAAEKSEDTGDQPAINQSVIDELQAKAGDEAKTAAKEEKTEQENIFDQYKKLESVFRDQKKQVEQKATNDGNRGTSSRTNISTRNRNNYAEILGSNFSLSTYAWEWAPYIEKMKEKMYQFWSVPPAYLLGLANGRTIIRVSISRHGKMTYYKLLRHDGNESLQLSSEDVVHAIFDLPELPPNFPDNELTITMELIYPLLRRQ
ncbi:MAG: TonB C-terminal domain-containing protein [Calditrichaeota bacterium]|nr:TonB C-terminal domain-containing protein [Calditrichota bacterium]